MGIEDGDSFTTNNTQEENLPATSTLGTGRTVDQYYKGVANENPNTFQDLQTTLDRRVDLPSEIQANTQAQEELTQQKANTPRYKLGERAQINTQLDQLQQQKSGLVTEFRRIPEKIEGLRDQAEPYTGNIASSETVVRAVNPVRLQTLVEANTPLPGQEAPVRVVDLTPEQREKRINDAKFAKETREIWYSAENDSSRLPEDKRTQEEKDRDFEEEQEKAESIAVEALASNLMEGMVENNSYIDEKQKKWEISNPEVVKAFAEYAYHMETSESGVPTEMLREGYLGIERRIHELKNSVPSRESLAEIEDLQYFSDKVKAIENKARFSMTMWQMANEVNLAASGTQLSPEDFLLNLTSAGVDISTGTRYSHRDGNYFKAVMESYSSYNPGLRQDAGTQYYGSEVYDLSMRISEFAGHNDPADLSREDIPRIFAYLGALVEKNNGSIKQQEFSSIDVVLKVALREIKQIRPDHITFSDILDKVRLGNKVEKPAKRLGHITQGYSSLLHNSGKNVELRRMFGAELFSGL